jgi:tetratricopeptide (TPR) repeat protein
VLKQAQEDRQPGKLVSIGDAYASFGDSVRASQYYTLAIDAGGDERTIFPRLLDMCIRDRQFRAALFHVEDYLRRHPGNMKLRFLAGSLYASMGEVKLAHSEYETAALGEPKNAELQYAFAVLSRDHEGNLLAADAHFRAYLSLEPSGAHAEEARSSLLQSVR